jgi:hypothetical protein
VKEHRIEKKLMDVSTYVLECDYCGRVEEEFHIGMNEQPMPDGWVLISAWNWPYASKNIDICPDCMVEPVNELVAKK